MAIVNMKRLRVMLVRSRKEELLKELTRLGCVQLTELETDEVLRPESSDLLELRSRQADLDRAIQLLNAYAPVKKPLLSAKPEREEASFLDDEGLDEASALARQLLDLEDKVRRDSAEESRQRGIIESLTPWKDLDLPLETEGTERTSLLLGTMSQRMNLAEAQNALAAAADEAELFPISGDKSQRYLALVCMKDQLSAAQESLRPFGFTALSFSGQTGTAREGIAAAEEKLKTLAEDKEACRAEIVSLASHREELELASDRMGTRIAMAEAEERLGGTESTLVLEGWAPAEREEELEQLFDKLDCAWETRTPEEDEYPEVPVKLKNNKLTNALNMVTDMYSLPAYGTVDPNPLMAPFFLLFYGLMMADMGYGLIMMLAAVVAIRKLKPREGSLAFCQLLLYGGISTFIFGALTGGLFGDAPAVLARMLGSDWEGLPALFSPVRDSQTVLYGAMVLGVIHLNVGMIVSFVQKAKAGNILDGVFEEGPLWVILLGGVLMGLQMLVLKDLTILKTIGLVILIVGAVMLLYGAGRHAKGFGKVTAAFGIIYNTLTGWFGDILSYSRIMALMLAGGVVAQVFNSIAAMPAEGAGVNPLTILVFILIFLVGHALNFGLNLLGCFVHDLRLQCLEFFGKFYQDGGKPFQPLRIRGKYAVPKE